jgi:hypothetical protein
MDKVKTTAWSEVVVPQEYLITYPKLNPEIPTFKSSPII